jgi:hypothetical protein
LNLCGAGSVQRVTVLAHGHGEASIDRVIAEPLNPLTVSTRSETVRIQSRNSTLWRASTAALCGTTIVPPRSITNHIECRDPPAIPFPA